MLTSLQITNFRGFKTLALEPLKRVNIIVGQNNTGKTGLLEALALLLGGQQQRAKLPNLFRTVGGEVNENFWKWIRYNGDPEYLVDTVEIRVKGNDLLEFGVWLEVPHVVSLGQVDRRVHTTVSGPAFRPPNIARQVDTLGSMPLSTFGRWPPQSIKVSIFSTHPTNPKQDAVDYNRVVQRRKKKDVETLLRKIEPKLEAVESLQTGSEPLLYADVGLSEMLPVTQMGQGFNRLLDIYSELLAAEAEVLLIDEVENGLHHSVLTTIWRGLLHAAKDADVQVFATTHSLECIRAAHEVFSEQPEYDLAVIQLFRVPEGIEGRVLDRKHIEAAMAGEIDLR